jgi:hypothetical protein
VTSTPDVAASPAPGPVSSEPEAAPSPADIARLRHAPAVLTNNLRLEQRWAQPWLAFNVFIRADPAGAAALSAVQDEVMRLEPSLLRLPAAALHTTAAFLLPGQAEFDRPKDEIWRQHGPRWLARLTELAAACTPFHLIFRRLIATDAAIIAVAQEPNPLTELRRRLRLAGLDLPGEPPVNELVHVTLFRYAGPLRDPAALLDWLATADPRAVIEVGELVVARENTFPFLRYDVLRRISLASASLAS